MCRFRERSLGEVPETVIITPGKLLDKGQIAAMIRQVDYPPPYTDILGTENQ